MQFCDANPRFGNRKIATIMTNRLGRSITHKTVRSQCHKSIESHYRTLTWRIRNRRDHILQSTNKELSVNHISNQAALDFEKRFCAQIDCTFIRANITHELARTIAKKILMCVFNETMLGSVVFYKGVKIGGGNS